MEQFLLKSEKRNINTKSFKERISRNKSLIAKKNFILTQRLVHLDLKGAPFKLDYFLKLIPFIKKLKFTGILLEWEDMFPYTGVLKKAVNGNAYTRSEIEKILSVAQQENLEIVPLVQTFGHLEWILKLEEFAYLRDGYTNLQVICIGLEDAWKLITDMISQVAKIHFVFGMKNFHIGADEIFKMGNCFKTRLKIEKFGNKDKTILWHIKRTANFIKKNFKVDVLVWHDMLEKIPTSYILNSNVSKIVQPILWSYAEDLSQYLPINTWSALQPFKNIWVASAFKGAHQPNFFSSNPNHYILNHESWINQLKKYSQNFTLLKGMIFTGWSRYDHFAVLCETFPVSIPALAMSSETIIKGHSLHIYSETNKILNCTLSRNFRYVQGCIFPGYKVYEVINKFYAQLEEFKTFKETNDYLKGWLSLIAKNYSFSSSWYLEKLKPTFNEFISMFTQSRTNLRYEMLKIFFPDAVEEFIQTYLNNEIHFLQNQLKFCKEILKKQTFPRRPFIQ